ncbi:MAG: hypothetical protein WCH34_11170 [Bacteroidota bacterium]
MYYVEYRRINKEIIEENSRKDRERKKSLSYYLPEFIESFIKENESKEFQQFWEAKKRWYNKNEKNEWPLVYIEYLEDIPEQYFAIEPAKDWRIAVQATWERYKRNKVIELLPYAHEQYLEHKGEKWNYEGREEHFSAFKDDEKGIQNTIRKHILEGRKLKGEPLDFNF